MELRRRKPPQLVVNQRQQLARRQRFILLDGVQDSRDFSHCLSFSVPCEHIEGSVYEAKISSMGLLD
jgi:hypothetical protein